MSTQTTNEHQQLNDDQIYDESTFRPWHVVIRGRSTCTANAHDIQQLLRTENKDPITRKDIPKALHDRNLLRQTEVIQISSNLKYVSIQFETSMLMEAFCTNPLNVKNFLLTFKPGFTKRQTCYQEPETISFLNVPSEADKDSMTQFVHQYARVIDRPRYRTEDINDIEYLTGTMIYRVHSRHEHIPPKIVKLFGWQIKCIHTNQPEQQEWLKQKKREEQRRNNDSLHSDDDDESTQQNSNTDTETEEEQYTQNMDSETETT